MKYFKSIATLVFSASILALPSCKHEQITNDINWDLYELAKETKGYTWFKFSSASLPKSSGSGHSNPFLRTRFNDIASTQLDSVGRVKAGINFPEGSVIVKELLGSDNTLERYAVLLKETTNQYADDKGWVWGYINADGGVAAKAEDKGRACTDCHSQLGSIDYVLMNKFFP